MVHLVAVIGLFLVATPAMAQSPYVIAGVGADISRFNRFTSSGVSGLEVDGESMAGALRVGTGIGDAWGVELEFVRPAVHEIQQMQRSPLVSLPPFPSQGTLASFTLSVGPAPQYQVDVRRRSTTFSTLTWIRQDLADRLSLVYLGGIAFHRLTQENRVEIIPPGRVVAGSGPRSTESVGYSAGPVAGMEARIRLTEHVLLVPGVRLHGVTGGWIFRPNVGVGWSF